MHLYKSLQVWQIDILPVETYHGKNMCSLHLQCMEFKFPPKWRNVCGKQTQL